MDVLMDQPPWMLIGVAIVAIVVIQAILPQRSGGSSMAAAVRNGPELVEVASRFFVFTNKTKLTDIPKATLTHLRVDSSVRVIPNDAFQNCRALVHVQLPETLTTIGICVFDGCSRLERVQFVSRNASHEFSSINVNLEDGLIAFPERAGLQLGSYAFPRRARLQLGSYSFSYCHSLRKVIFCSVSTKLNCGVFSFCEGLLSVVLPEGLQLIEKYSFWGCRSLTAVNIPSSVIEIGEGAFYQCRRLASFDLPYGLRILGKRSLANCGMETLYIPLTVSAIGKAAFFNCTLLGHIILPPTLERIELCTFAYCKRLEYIEIPSTVCFIGECAFAACISLSHIRLPPSLGRMTHWALECCCNLISIELPEGLLVGSTEADGFVDRDIAMVNPRWNVVLIERLEGIIVFSLEGDEFLDSGTTGFSSLVNLATPTTEDFEFLSGVLHNYSKLGKTIDDKAGLVWKLKHRFDSSPLHKLCYYQSYYSSEDAMAQLRCLIDENPFAASTQVDEFGMTPLHILSLSQTVNVDMLLAVMQAGRPDHIIHGKDSFDSTPMDYLCLNRTPASTEVIRSVLLTRFAQLLGLGRSRKSEMLQSIDEALAVDWSLRRREIVAVYLKLVTYEE
eukprot:scaffold22532_cov93-Cylindrotheca_fusiformis.AAC.5